MSRRHRAHQSPRQAPSSDGQRNQPCAACSALWATFEATGETGSQRFHRTCMQLLCGPRLNEPADTMVKRKAPQLLPPGAKGWWEL